VTRVLVICSLVVAVWARLSLERNIGFVPALRELDLHGAYRYGRHPIYTGIFLNYLAFAMRIYSPRNVLIAGLGTFWFVIKSFVEEDLLRADPQYAAYMRRVRALDSLHRLRIRYRVCIAPSFSWAYFPAPAWRKKV
jgi:protein-S-isoprenylcysteine O-methyltransferase Ste14